MESRALCTVLVAAIRRRSARFSHRLSGQNGTARERESDWFAGNISPDKRDQIVRTIGAAIERVRCREHAALLAADTCRPTTCSDRDSHGVSDPSGQARGHFGRAQRGRSRHGFHLRMRHRHLQWAAKSAAQSLSVSRAPAQVPALERVLNVRRKQWRSRRSAGE